MLRSLRRLRLPGSFTWSLAVLWSFAMMGCGWAASPPAEVAASSSPEASPEATASSPSEQATPSPNKEGPVATPPQQGEQQQPTPLQFLQQQAAQLHAARQAVSQQQEKVWELTERVVALQTDVEGLKQQLANLQRALADQQDAGTLSHQALGAMAENPQLRGELGEMLQGKVRLTNSTGQDQIVYINGTPWTVLSGPSYIYAPVGTVSFLQWGEAIPSFKGVQEWRHNETTGQFELSYEVVVPTSTTREGTILREEPILDETSPPSTGERSVLQTVFQPTK